MSLYMTSSISAELYWHALFFTTSCFACSPPKPQRFVMIPEPVQRQPVPERFAVQSLARE